MAIRAIVSRLVNPTAFKRLAIWDVGTAPAYPPFYIKPTAEPTATAAEGDIYYNTSTKQLYHYNGSAWISLVDLSSTQTLTGKTLTSPTLTTPTITRAVYTGTAAIQSTATLAVTAAMSGRTFVDTQGSGTTTFTLPDAGTTQGLIYDFVCGDAAGEILITPATGDKIVCKASDGGAAIAPAAGTGIKNTAATNIKGDHITLTFDGVDTWWATSQAGVWASQ